MDELNLDVDLEAEVIQRVCQAHLSGSTLCGLRHRVRSCEPRLSLLLAKIIDYIFSTRLELSRGQLGNYLPCRISLELLTI